MIYGPQILLRLLWFLWVCQLNICTILLLSLPELCVPKAPAANVSAPSPFSILDLVPRAIPGNVVDELK